MGKIYLSIKALMIIVGAITVLMIYIVEAIVGDCVDGMVEVFISDRVETIAVVCLS